MQHTLLALSSHFHLSLQIPLCNPSHCIGRVPTLVTLWKCGVQLTDTALQCFCDYCSLGLCTSFVRAAYLAHKNNTSWYKNQPSSNRLFNFQLLELWGFLTRLKFSTYAASLCASVTPNVAFYTSAWLSNVTDAWTSCCVNCSSSTVEKTVWTSLKVRGLLFEKKCHCLLFWLTVTMVVCGSTDTACTTECCCNKHSICGRYQGNDGLFLEV